MTVPKPRRIQKVQYLSNRNFLEQLALSNERGSMTNELARMFMKLTERYALRANWRYYSYNDEMQADAICHLCAIWFKFDANKSQNPFAFFTTCLTNIFRRRLKLEQKQADIRDKLLSASGAAPSWRAWDNQEAA